MSEYDIEQITAPDGTICNIRDKRLSLLNEQLEDILETGGEPVLISKTITENGTYRALDDNANGYREVPVDVPTSAETFAFLFVTAETSSSVTVSKGATTLPVQTSTGSELLFKIPESGIWTVTAEKTGETTQTQTVSITATDTYRTSIAFPKIYGVIWDKSSSTSLTRTDSAANFSDPDPYVADGVHSGSSPFDTIMPWSGMIKETIDGNSLVKIPKFWYKITNDGNSLKFQIADHAEEGFKVSPAHKARNQNETDRDYVYIGRYKCAFDICKSQSGYSPETNISRSTARSWITTHGGTDCYLQDFAMYWTIRMLYIVEFANWDSQTKIGYGCGNNSGSQYTGASDAMSYHTGTMQTSRTSYGAGCQYRWIEDLWGNVYEWIDGIRFSGSTIYAYLDPSTYSDSSDGTSVGSRATTSNEISDWSTPSDSDYDWFLYPSAVVSNTNYDTYVCDRCGYNSSGVVLYTGGHWSQSKSNGLFYLHGAAESSYAATNIGARLMYLP